MQPEQFWKLQNTSPGDGATTLRHCLDVRRRCRILIVDDDALVRGRLANLLRASQFDVEMAASGEDAMRIMASVQCQILLTDWQMPDMDGLSLCRNIRTSCGDRYVYVLMLTVRDRKEDLLMGLAAGVDDYIVKGVPIEEILARVEVARRITEQESPASAGDRANERDSHHDALTGAYNLRYLMNYLPRELERSRRYGHALAVLHCDLDGFKETNERFGRDAGDELLRAFVARAQSCTRKNCDWLARVGGDEFMIVLPETTIQGSNRVAQKLREILAMFPVATKVGPVNFSASIGITAIEPKYEHDGVSELEAILCAAGRGLRSSKGRGSNSATAAAISSGITIALDWRTEDDDETH